MKFLPKMCKKMEAYAVPVLSDLPARNKFTFSCTAAAKDCETIDA